MILHLADFFFSFYFFPITTSFHQNSFYFICRWNLRSDKMAKDYDYLLKVLLVGDSDVGKHEIMAGLEDGSTESPFCSGGGNCK